MADIFVRDIMKTKPVCCNADTKVPEIAQLMEEHDCGAIPVVDEACAPKGVITDRDMVTRVIAHRKSADELTAKDVMTATAVTITRDAPAEEATKLMAQKMVRRLLVVDRQGKCIGMLSLADLSRACPAEYVGRLVKRVSEPTTEAAQL